MTNHNRIYRVMASVYPTPHNKIWLSSGRFSLYLYPMHIYYLNSLGVASKMDAVDILGAGWGKDEFI